MGAIGRLGLSIVGRMVGGPWGGLLGSIAGALLFPDRMPDQHTEGPRLNDLTVTTSTYGTTIPWVWGQYLVPGNIIWVGDVHEHSHTTETHEGGKGGGGATYSYTEYTYTVSLAVSLCKGPMHKVVKIFMNNSLVYDALGGTIDKQIPGLRWRFYAGDEAQLPDSIIEAKVGVGRVPAYRDRCYVVFDELDITAFGNAPPQMQFVVQDSGAETYVKLPLTQAAGQNAVFLVDLDRALKYQVGTVDGRATFETIDLYTQKTLYADDAPVGKDGHVYRDIISVLPDGRLVMQGEIYRYNVYSSYSIGIVNGFTHAVEREMVLPPASYIYHHGTETGASGTYVGLDGLPRVVAFMGRTAGNWALDAFTALGVEIMTQSRLLPFDLDAIQPQKVKYWGSFFTRKKVLANGLEFWWLHAKERPDGSGDSTKMVLSIITVTDIVPQVSFGGGGPTPVATSVDVAELSLTDFDPSGSLTTFWYNTVQLVGQIGPAGCYVDGILWDEYSETGLITGWGKAYVLHINAEGEILYQFRSKAGQAVFPNFCWRDGTISDGGTLGIVYGGGVQVIESNTAREVLDVAIPDIWTTNSSTYAYSPGGRLIVYPDAVYLLDQAGPGQIPISKIISDVSEAVDQPANDFSGIADLHVLGYASARVTDGRSIIDPLASAFNFDGVDAGGYMRWVKRGAPAVTTVTRDDMLVMDENTGSTLDETRAQDVDLPQAVSITYADADRNYEPVTFYAQRFAGNEGYETMRSQNRVSIEIPAAIEADIAKQSADKILMSLWNGRKTQKFKLPPWAVLYDPGDVITLELPGTFPQDVRIGKMMVGADLTVEIESSAQDSAQYTSLVTADPGVYDQPVLSREQFTKLYLLPTPYLTDAADTGARSSLTAYYAMSALRDGWVSGAIQRKPGDAPWITVGTLSHESPHGALIERLAPSESGMVFAYQARESMRVRLVHGDLQSTTYAQLMEGANAAAVIVGDRAEVVQFRDAVLEEDGSYTLSGLLRGRRGTDYWATTFEAPAGASFVLLGASLTGAVSEPLSSLGAVQRYRAFGANQLPERGDEEAIVLAGNELKPYAPAHPTFSINSTTEDITITWVRRSRVRGELRDLTGDVPLEEDTEAYSVDVIGDHGQILRTISATSPTITYLKTDQTADGFLLGMTVRIYQLSAQAGRGFPLTFKTPGVLVDVAAEGVVMLFQLPKPDVDVAQAGAVVLIGPSNVQEDVAQQSTVVLTQGTPAAQQDVSQQSTVVLTQGTPAAQQDVSQQSNIVLFGAPTP